MAQHRAPPLPTEPQKQGATPLRRALVVEAELATMRLCRDALEAAGFAVDLAETGIEAVISARQEHFDLILVDLQLRDVPGREAIEWLRSNPALHATPIIVLTASAGDDAELKAFQPASSLRKPVSLATLRRAIDRILDKSYPQSTGDQR
jgi:DNA-binding response OmpR family regulator